jgi:hypothetical protein
VKSVKERAIELRVLLIRVQVMYRLKRIVQCASHVQEEEGK